MATREKTKFWYLRRIDAMEKGMRYPQATLCPVCFLSLRPNYYCEHIPSKKKIIKLYNQMRKQYDL